MKKSIIFALLLSLLSVQQIHAQKWLKKLGKVAENVLANDQKTTNKTAGSIPGCTVKYTSCVANGNDVHINFVITNTTSSELKCTSMLLMTALVLLIARMSNIRCTSIWVVIS